MQKFETLRQPLLWFWIAVVRKEEKQAGAELCQAQVKLGWDSLSCKLFLIGNLESALAKRNNWYWIFHILKLRLSSISWKIEVVFHFLKNWGRLSFPKIVAIFYFPKNWGRLPFPEKFRSSSISWYWGHLLFPEKLRSSSISWKIEVVIHFLKNWGRLPFPEKLRSSSIL